MASSRDVGIAEPRGYRGSEKNRTLPPEEVIWAREEYFRGRITTRQLVAKWGMGMASVGRVLRGDTYANIGKALPRAHEIDQIIKHEAEEMDEALARLMKAQEERDARESAQSEGFDGPEGDPFGASSTSGEEAVEAYVKGSQGEQKGG